MRWCVTPGSIPGHGIEVKSTMIEDNNVVIYCNYCTAPMSVPRFEEPDDPMCECCKEARQGVSVETWRILEESDAEAGDRVEYDGYEWTVERSAAYTFVILRRYNFESGEIEKEAVCRSKVDVVNKAGSEQGGD